MKLKAIFPLMLGAMLSLSVTAWAGTATALASNVPMAQNTAAPANSDLTGGMIHKVDKASGKLTIKHGPIKNLDMPSMTMAYQVRSTALLDKVQAGDKVRFRAENEEGKFLITEIQPAR